MTGSGGCKGRRSFQTNNLPKAAMPMQYICALRNKETGGGMAAQLFYTDAAEAAKFVAQWSKPGFGVYDCIGWLKDGAARRRKEEVVELDHIVCDLDLKNIEQTRDQVLQCLKGLVLPPSEIRDSGFGLHAIWWFKEPVSDEPGMAQAEGYMKQLVTLLAGDPAPAHRAALLRTPSSYNSKDGAWALCHAIDSTGAQYDISEFSDMFDLYGDRALLSYKHAPEKSNGHYSSPFIANGERRAPVDIEAELAGIVYQDATHGVNATHCRVIPSLLRHGSTPDEVIEQVVDATMAMAKRDGLRWGRAEEVKTVTARVVSALQLVQKDSNPVETPPWLPPEFFERWTQKLAQGERPCFSRNKQGWHVRGYAWNNKREEEPVAVTQPAPQPQPVQPTAEVIAFKPPEGKKYRYQLMHFDDMRPGAEANYLVDELIPVAGLVVVYGAPKSGKSFWTLDLMMHVALGWEYRDRYVQQGTVIYCAFEGAHGYRKRCEAFRRHHCLTDERPAFYVVPGRADLIKDHAALIADIKGQLGEPESPIRAVVLDTLNKSLIGSESKDVDMANYIAAAEAIQKAFNCVVIIVHHHGIDDSRPRGHTSLRGAVDTQLKVTRGESEAEKGMIAVEVEDMRDGPEGAQVTSRLVVVEVGTDRSGKQVTSAAVEPMAQSTAERRVKLPKNPATLLRILEEAGPAGLSTEEWNNRARAAGLAKNRPASLYDFRHALLERKLVCQRGDQWLIASNQPDLNLG
jgi:hypothetical protein